MEEKTIGDREVLLLRGEVTISHVSERTELLAEASTAEAQELTGTEVLSMRKMDTHRLKVVRCQRLPTTERVTSKVSFNCGACLAIS